MPARDPFSGRVPRRAARNAWSAALAARNPGDPPLLDLTEGNPTRVGLPSLLDGASLAREFDSGRRHLPDPLGERAAREAVARSLGARHGAVDPDDVVLTTGTSESLAHLFRLLADPGDAVGVPRPGYPLFDPIAAAEGLRSEPYALAWDGGWHLDRGAFDRMLAAAPRAVALVEPHLPAGVRLPAEDWSFAIRRLDEAGVPAIVDEVFAEFAWGEEDMAFPGRVPRDRGLWFVLGGASKSCGLPQLKLGWITILGDPVLRARARAGLEWLADLFLSPVPALQAALPDLLERRDGFQRPLRARLRRNLAALDEWVAGQPTATRLAAEGGWVTLLRLPERRSDEDWALEFLGRGVAVHPGHFYDLDLPATVMTSLIVDPGVFDEGLRRIGEALAAD